LRILAGLLRPAAGTVERGGEVALLDDRLPLDGDLPLGRALGLWRQIDGIGYGPEHVSAIGLEALTDVPVRYLSTGQRKRAAILVSNARAAALWLLDEPLNGLDVDAAAEFEERVAGHLARGGIVVVASHQPFHVPGLERLHLSDYAP
jgi:heme exporter protein A